MERFEKEFASFCGCKFAVGVGSGTAALWMALLALGVRRGDEVITVPNTFIATCEAISFCGAKPVFVDIDENTYNMDPALLEDCITPKTKAIIPVHLYGQMADMDRIMEISRAHGLFVIEDACQAYLSHLCHQGREPRLSYECFGAKGHFMWNSLSVADTLTGGLQVSGPREG